MGGKGPSAAQNQLADQQAALAGSETSFYNLMTNYMPEIQAEQQQTFNTLFPEAQTIFQESQQNYATQQAFANTLMTNYATEFAGQQAILGHLTLALNPIVSAGPSQFGFSDAETQALMSQATEGVAQQYSAAAKNTLASIAAQSNGVLLPSGAANQINAELNAARASQQSAEQLGILTAGYQQGNQNFFNASQLLSGVGANLTNPTSAASAALSGLSGSASSLGTGANALSSLNNSLSGSLGALSGFSNAISGSGNAATNAGNAAFNQATTIQQMNNANSPWSIAGGLLGGLAGTALGGLTGGASTALTSLANPSPNVTNLNASSQLAPLQNNGLGTLTMTPSISMGGLPQ